MDRHKVANIISRCRRQKGVQQEVLCRGICSNANYSRIESGDAEIPLVMVQAFLERLGVDPGQLEQLLEGEDYSFYRKRRDIEKALQDGLDAQAGQLLDAYEGAVGEDRLEIQYVKYCRAQVAHLHMRQDASLNPGERERLARDAGQLLQEAESLTILQRRRGMLLSRTELGILLVETEGIGPEEMQYIQDFVRRYYNREWKEEYLPQVQLKYAGLLAEKGEYDRALAEIRQGLAAVKSGKSYRCCADLHFLAAQVAGRMNGKVPGKKEQKEQAWECWQAYRLYDMNRNPRAEEVKDYMKTAGLAGLVGFP